MTRKKAQFMFDDRVMEFDVEWSSMALGAAIENSMGSDGYMWVGTDPERDSGTFINLARCTCINLVEEEPEG